jgi:hypothetical protein
MAQTKKKRRRKHRGTQGGRIDTNRRAARPRNRAEAKARARSGAKRAPRADGPPTWRGAASRGAIAAVIFTAALLLVFRRSLPSALGLGAFMLVFYIPAGYYIDTMMWRRRERAKMRGADRS